jgi:hypothetical protein
MRDFSDVLAHIPATKIPKRKEPEAFISSVPM